MLAYAQTALDQIATEHACIVPYGLCQYYYDVMASLVGDSIFWRKMVLAKGKKESLST